MPRFGCRCGHSIALHAIPNPNEAQLVWDVDAEQQFERRKVMWHGLADAQARGGYDAWVGQLDGRDPGSRSLADVLEHVLRMTNLASRCVVRCPECGRLYVERGHRTNEYDCYQIEPDA